MKNQKRKKIPISLEEYTNVLTKLKYINEEKINLEKISQQQNAQLYQAHIRFPNTFEELLITLIRENEIIDNKINLTRKEFLLHLNANPSVYKEIERKVDQLINHIATSPTTPLNNLDTELTPIQNNYQKFEDFILTITELYTKREANNYLYDYVKRLQIEKEHCLTIKNSYEKQKKKLKVKKRTPRKRLPNKLK